MKSFNDRKAAAEALADALKSYKNLEDAIILAIPRGALEMGAILRDKLGLPLDIVVTKKIGAPNNGEFAIGVVDPEGKIEYDEDFLRKAGIPMSYLKEEAERLRHVIKRRYEDYRGDPSPPDFKGKTCLVVDDGIATGRTTEAAVHYLRRQKVKKIILAVPVAAPDTVERLKQEVDELVCLKTPLDFQAVGQFYHHFPQVSDNQAIRFLGKRKTAQ